MLQSKKQIIMLKLGENFHFFPHTNIICTKN